MMIKKDILNKNTSNLKSLTPKSYLNNTHKKSKMFSVSAKLNFVTLLVFISGLITIIGAYEIQMGGRLHELNYFHQKYITELAKNVSTFENHSTSINNVKKNIMLIRKQAVKCTEFINDFELFILRLIGTHNTLTVCYDDITIADNLLLAIQKHSDKDQNINAMNKMLHQGIIDFERSGEEFESLVSKTVDVLFLIVITVLITKAFIVPIIGIILSRSVFRDYQLLLKTKKNLEEEQAKNALIQSERVESLTIMVAGIAHEINTPIGISITANSYLEETLAKFKALYVNEELTKSKFVDFIIAIEKSNIIITKNLSRTANLVKSFKQVSVDQFIDERQNITLKPYIEQILVSLSPILDKANVTLTLSCNHNLKANIYGGVFSQIITNLVTNAINHAFKDKDAGTLTLSVAKRATNEICFSFTDNGCGISSLNKVHIFDPFFTTKRNNGGTGLGLHILHNLVTDKLMGRVLCTSEVNKGTRFDIFFPSNITDEKI